MRTGSDDFKDGSAVSDEEPHIFDWLNLPSGAIAVSLWDCLHDGQVVSVRSNLLERTMNLSCEIEHLRTFHKLDEGFQFVLHLEGVQSARLLCYAIWPGGCSIPEGISVEDHARFKNYCNRVRDGRSGWSEGVQLYDDVG